MFLCREESQRVVDVILSRRQDFGVFDTYISEYDRSMSLLEESCRNNLAFACIVKKFEVNHWAARLDPEPIKSALNCVSCQQLVFSIPIPIPKDPLHGQTGRSILTVTYSDLKFSFHVYGVKVKPCGCFQGAEIEPGISPGTHAATLYLDFVTQLPRGDNGLSKPSPLNPDGGPLHGTDLSTVMLAYFISTQHQILILCPAWISSSLILPGERGSGIWVTGSKFRKKTHSKTITVVHGLCAWST